MPSARVILTGLLVLCVFSGALISGLLPGPGGDRASEVQAANNGSSAALPGHDDLEAALQMVVEQGGNAGLANDMWATVVDRDGNVTAVAFSGGHRGDQWPGSRVISAQKANTANAFSLPDGSRGVFPGLALSTANLYSAVQPGGSLFGLQESNPVDTGVAYRGNPPHYGTDHDPMVGRRIGGVNVFGGGLALYDDNGEIVGALGVSGDTSCTDHIIAWKLRDALGLDNVPTGVSSTGDDNIIFDIMNGTSAGGFGHPECDTNGAARGIAEDLPCTHPIGSVTGPVACP
jgi:uncharacterized protein GlcG (DUF336 family)